MLSGRQRDVEDFFKNLLSGEYTIDPKANEIKFLKSSLAQELSEALTMYEQTKMGAADEASPYFASNAFSMITAAFSHGVINRKSDVLKTLRETENRLQQCESANEQLQKNNKDLIKKLHDQADLIKEYEKRQNDEPSSVGGVSSV
jgi:hypothetical protein